MIGVLKGALGVIHSINTKDYTAKVKLLDYENRITGELMILSPLSYINKEVHIPKINTPVFCIFTGEGANNGFIIGSFFSEKNRSGAIEGEYEINFQNSVITIKEDGNVRISADLTTIDSKVEITENVSMKKKLIVNEGIEVGKGLQMNSTGKITTKGSITSEDNMYAKEFLKK